MKAFVVRFSLSLGLFVAGCGHTETHAALVRPPSLPTTRRVELYLLDQPEPSRPSYEVAFVQAIGFGTEANPEDLARALTAKAAALGCDAVVRVSMDVGISRAHAAGVCVKYAEIAPSNSAPPPKREPSKGSPAPTNPTPGVEPPPSAIQGR